MPNATPKPVLAAIQAAPVYFNPPASIAKACRLIAEAGTTGASLAVFGETWLPGYPFHAFHPTEKDWWTASAAYLESAIAIPGPETAALCEAALEAGLDVIIGVAERDTRTNGTVYCTMLSIGSDGRILGKHRKLVPTRLERIAWGQGAGDDLDVFQRDYGRISALNCWEHQMLLPAYTLMSKGTQFHAASWPRGDPQPIPDLPVASWPRMEILSRAFAVQGACYVVSASLNLTPEDVPEDFRHLARISPGVSMIVDPRGEVIAQSEMGEESIITAEADLALIRSAKAANDVAGHYARPDVFELRVRGQQI